MKHLMLTTVAILSLAITHAQLNLSAGPNAGFGHAWTSGSGESKYQPAGNFGVALVYSHNNHVGFGLDLKYSIEGGKKDFTNVNGTPVTTRLNYLRIPIK